MLRRLEQSLRQSRPTVEVGANDQIHASGDVRGY